MCITLTLQRAKMCSVTQELFRSSEGGLRCQGLKCRFIQELLIVYVQLGLAKDIMRSSPRNFKDKLF